MDFDREVAGIIEQAKNELAELASKAALQQDFGQLARLASLAQRLSQIADQTPSDSQSGHAPERATNIYNERAGDLSTSRPFRRTTSLPRSGREGYPRFHREGDVLIKIGWSKSDRRPYEHRSPFEVVDQLVSQILRFGQGGARFTTEQLLPLHSSDGAEWPSYQVYLCLAWLVAEGLLDRYGRQGYTIKSNDLANEVHTKWAAMARG